MQDRRRTQRARRRQGPRDCLGHDSTAEALDLAMIRWEVAYRSEIKALEGVCTGAIPCGSQGWLDQR